MYVKFQYQSFGEEIKFHVMQVPGAPEPEGNEMPAAYYRATITIESLTPHFYPQIYLKKVGLEDEPTELNTLEFPTIDVYNKAFGEDPTP
jgi:hypothetical protein